jgi:3-isopropylmalate/(R)-2-methylmalate dehydratase small subunit
MFKYKTLTSYVVPLPINNIDTGQIIPSRFLKVTDKHGLGEHLFEDWRYLASGSPDPNFVLNQLEVQGAKIILTGDNFGCGSSREHAVWALVGWGFRAVISTSFADIFRVNALKNSLLPVVVDTETHQALFTLLEGDRRVRLTINLPRQTLTLPDGRTIIFPIDTFSKRCLVDGVDQLDYLLSFEKRIADYEIKYDQI